MEEISVLKHLTIRRMVTAPPAHDAMIAMITTIATTVLVGLGQLITQR